MSLRLSDFIISVGRPVAVYPGLRKLTGSLASTVLLCQFLYWSDKTKDGWFYKSSDELIEETSLSYEEQKAARVKLTGLGVIEEQYRRSEHKLYFRVKKDVLNSKWEALALEGKEVEKEKSIFDIEDDILAIEDTKRTPKKKDLVDGIIEMMDMPGIKKANLKLGIESKISTKLGLNPSGRRWEDFINFAADRWINHKENIDTFIAWVLDNDYNPVYASAERFRTVWPSAFVNNSALDNTDSFVVKSNTVKKEENYAPIPVGLGRRS
jgi:hypothetical protein